jgi:arsenate reductase (glutaredoxin)
MSSLHVYEYAKCGTCRSAVKWLKAQGHEVTTTPLFDTPPNKEELRELVRLSGLDLRKFFNVSGDVYKAENLKDRVPLMTEEEMLELLSSNGRLIKRPIVSDGKRVTVGFKEAEYEKVWGQ